MLKSFVQSKWSWKAFQQRSTRRALTTLTRARARLVLAAAAINYSLRAERDAADGRYCLSPYFRRYRLRTPRYPHIKPRRAAARSRWTCRQRFPVHQMKNITVQNFFVFHQARLVRLPTIKKQTTLKKRKKLLLVFKLWSA